MRGCSENCRKCGGLEKDMKHKILSASLAAAMLLSAVPCRAATLESVEQSRFDSFGDYISAFSATRTEAYPNGYGATSYAHMANAGSSTDDERFGKVVKLGTGASMLLPLGSVFEAGKGGNGWIHLSFDIKLDSVDGVETSKNKQFQLLYNSSWSGNISYAGGSAASSKTGWINGQVNETNHTYDVDNPNEVPGDKPSNFVTIGADNLGRKMETYHAGIYKMWNTGSDKATNHFSKKGMSADEWHKLEVYVRQKTGNYIVYLDGEKVDTYSYDKDSDSYGEAGQWAKITPGWWNTGENKVKGFELRSNNQDDYIYPDTASFPGESAEGRVDANDGGAFLIDNVYMKFYRTNDELSSTSNDLVVFDSPELVCDDNGGLGMETSGGRIAVACSEWLSSPVSADNVTVTNAVTGAKLTNFTVENSNNMQFELVFDDTEIESGNYLVTLSGVRGAVTSSSITASGTFKTRADVENVDGVDIIVPRVDSVKLKTWQDKEVKESTGLTSEIKKIYLTFSTAIDSENLTEKITVADKDEEIGFTYAMEDYDKTVVLTLDKLLKPSSNYTITADNTIFAKQSKDLSKQVCMKSPYTYSFATPNDASLRIIDSSLEKNGANWNASVQLLKTTEGIGKYTIAAVIYEKNAYGEDSPIGIEYKSILMADGERNVNTYTFSGKCRKNSTSKIKLFVMEYPTQKVIMTKTVQN